MLVNLCAIPVNEATVREIIAFRFSRDKSESGNTVYRIQLAQFDGKYGPHAQEHLRTERRAIRLREETGAMYRDTTDKSMSAQKGECYA